MAIGVYSTKDAPGAGGEGAVHIQEYKEINVGDIDMPTTVMVEQVVMDSDGAVVYDAREHFAGKLALQEDDGE